jgi:predicted outer membrane repeat protein
VTWLQDALLPEGAKSTTNVAVFTSVKFTNNTSANGGSAVHLISSSFINQIVATTNFTDW